MMSAATEALDSMMKLPLTVREGLENLRQLTEADVEVGCTPKDKVFELDHVTVYKYSPEKKGAVQTPVLISYALVNRPYMVDLQEDRSLVRSLLSLGMEVYLVDWGYPGPLERWLTLDDLIDDYLDACVDAVREQSGFEAINLLGICQGGVFSLLYTALHPEKIKNLITMVVPVDFHVKPTPESGLLNAWIRGLEVDTMVDTMGNIPGDLMNFGYLMLRPFQLNVGKYLSLPDTAKDMKKLVSFLRMEKWIFDSPDQPGEVFRKFIRDFYQGNKLVKGEVELNGRTVDLGQIRQPVLNVYAELDHLVPPESSRALEAQVGTDDYTVKGFETGHIGMYVSGKVQRELPKLIGSWLEEREK